MRAKPCAFCPKSFVPTRKTDKFCSLECKRRHAAARQTRNFTRGSGGIDIDPKQRRRYFTEGHLNLGPSEVIL